MNKFTKIGSAVTLVCSILLITTLSACNEANTTSDESPSTDNNGEVATADNSQATQADAQSETRKKQIDSDTRAREQRNNSAGDPENRADAEDNSQATQADAQSETRKKQLNSDIRAREQRNDIAGDPEKRAEADLISEVRSKLEANMPSSKLTVSSNDANVTVSGVVKTQADLDRIQPLAMEIQGVNTVIVKAVVNP